MGHGCMDGRSLKLTCWGALSQLTWAQPLWCDDEFLRTRESELQSTNKYKAGCNLWLKTKWLFNLKYYKRKKKGPSRKHSVLGRGWWNIPKSTLWITSDTELVDLRVRAYSTQLGVSDAIWGLKVGGKWCSSVLPKPLLWLPIHTLQFCYSV